MEMTAAALWLNTAFAGLDEWAAVAVHRLYELAPGFFTPFLTLITYMGKGGIFLILLSFALMMLRPTRRYGTAMLLAVAIGALITNLTVQPLVARPRPYTWEGSVYKEYWIMLGRHTESDKSFPSGHMTAAMAASTAVFLCGRRKISWTAFFFAFFMGVSRIYLSVHYTSDVLGGVITGGIGGVAGYFVSLRIPGWFYEGDAKDLLPGYKQQGRHQAAPRDTVSQDTAREEAAPEETKEIVIDGEHFSDLRGFYAEISSALGLPEDKRVGNMDALSDVLRGGFAEGDAIAKKIRWLHSEKSRGDLGFEATAAHWERMLRKVPEANREKVQKRLDDAREGKGPTLFDSLTRLISRAEDCTLSLE